MAGMAKQQMTPGTPSKPAGLSKAAGAAWDEIVADLQESGIRIAKAHRTLLLQAAELQADAQDAAEHVALEGTYYTNDKTGVITLHPAAKRLDALRRDFVRIMSLLGMRSAVATGGPSKEKTGAALLDG